MVKFIDEASIADDRKQQYIKIIRGQLSNHEQLLLFYNGVSDFGKRWIENDEIKEFSGYIGKYRLIHNIPKPLANFGITPTQVFNKDIAKWKNMDPTKKFFEWDEN